MPEVRKGREGASKLRREVCGGSILQCIDESHALRFSCGVTWCDLCGGFASRWPRSLLLPCRRRPWSAGRRNVLRRLRLGLPPSAAEHLQKAIANSGAPMGAPDFASEMTWRRGPELADEGARGGGSSPQAQLAARGPTGVARPPTGNYSRLPAHRRSQGADEQGATRRGAEELSDLHGQA